jgi:hypothetical protein
MYFWEREVYINVLVNHNQDLQQQQQHTEATGQYIG